MSTPIKTVGVCGAAGTMGAGIAIVSARAGYRTIGFDISEEALSRAARQTAGFFAKSVERGRLTSDKRDAILASMESTTDMAALAQCDLVIEAVFEDLATKRSLLGELDGICPAPTIFASNTSTLSITEIAAGCQRPDRVVGLHFCLPAQLMKLIEVSPGLLTSEETLQTAWAWTEACGQKPVRTQDKPGFILNALLVPFNNDAIARLQDGSARTDRPHRARHPGAALRGLLSGHA